MTVNVSLTPQQEAKVRERVSSGQYVSVSEVVRAALRLLDKYEEDYTAWLKQEVMKGVEQIRQGEVKPFDDEAVERIKSRGRKRLKSAQK